MKDEEKFDDLIRQKASDHKAPVPADAWDNIIQKKKKRRFIFFWWCVAGVLLAGNAGYLIYKNQEVPSDSIKTVQQNQLPTSTSSKEQLISEEKKRGEGTDLHNEKTDGLNNSQATIDNTGRKNGSGKEVADNKKENEIYTQAKERQEIKEPGKKVNKKNTLATIEKIGNHKKNIAGNNAKSQQSELEKVRQNQSSSAIVKTESDWENSNLLGGKGRAFSKNGENEIGGGKSEIAAKIVATTEDGTASEKDAFTLLKKLEEGVANEKNVVAKDGNNDRVKTVDHLEKVEKLVSDDTNFSIGNIDSVAQLTNALSDKKSMQNIGTINSSKWWIDISAAPFASFSTSKTISQLNRTTQMAGYVAQYSANKVKISQEPGVVYNIAVRKNVNRRWAFGIGFQYQQIKEKINLSGTETHTSTTIVQRLDQNTTGPFLVNDTIVNVASGIRTIDVLNSYTLMSVPIFVQYHLANKKHWLIDWTIGGFVNVSRKYSNSVSGIFTEQNSNDIKAGNNAKIGFDLFTELRFSYPLAKNIFVFTAPGFRYNLSEYKMQGMFKYTFLHQAGVSFGLSVKIPGKR